MISRVETELEEAFERHRRELHVHLHIRVTMPPDGMVFEGIEGIALLLERAFGEDREGDWRLGPTAANRMLPRPATYVGPAIRTSGPSSWTSSG